MFRAHVIPKFSSLQSVTLRGTIAPFPDDISHANNNRVLHTFSASLFVMAEVAGICLAVFGVLKPLFNEAISAAQATAAFELDANDIRSSDVTVHNPAHVR
jgi:hypothetical protein